MNEYILDFFTNISIDTPTDSQVAFDRAGNIMKLLRPSFTSVELCRLGRENDGGYIGHDDFNSNDFLISCGVFDDTSFEEDVCPKISGAFIIDYSIDSLPSEINNAIFLKNKISGSSFADTTRFMKIVRESNKRMPKDKILKMDIEGWEWDVLANTNSDTLNEFRQIFLEIHGLSKILNNEAYEIIIIALNNIKKTHFISFVNANNYSKALTIGNHLVPEVMELTLFRKNSFDYREIDLPNFSEFSQRNNPESIQIPFPIY
jgi:hypothetical protein